MNNTTKKPRRSFLRSAGAALVVLLLIAAAALMIGRRRLGAPAQLHPERALAPYAAACGETAQKAVDDAYEASKNAFVPYVTETTALLAKADAAGTTVYRKAYDLRQAPYGPEGTAGRLIIPSAGINVALNLPGEDAQATADAEDSACWMEIRSDLNGVVGDHVNQDFATLFRVRPGDSCSIFKNGREHRYLCVSIGYGSNIETDVLDAEGKSLFDCGDDRLCMYTCANGWQNIFYVQWQTDGSRPLHQYENVLYSQSFILEEDDG